MDSRIHSASERFAGVQSLVSGLLISNDIVDIFLLETGHAMRAW